MDVSVSTRAGFQSFWYRYFGEKVLVEELVPWIKDILYSE